MAFRTKGSFWSVLRLGCTAAAVHRGGVPGVWALLDTCWEFAHHSGVNHDQAAERASDSRRPGEKPAGSADIRAGDGAALRDRSAAEFAVLSDRRSNPELSIVVPLWNEELNVNPLVQRILQAFPPGEMAVELLLVDDASTDGTWGRMIEVQKAEPRLRPVRLLRHSGQSAALWAGFNASRGSIIATLDGDLQNDPADLPGMIRELARNDLVCGVRTKRQDNALRRVSSAIARWARKVALGVDFRDTGCNLRAFKRNILSGLFPFNGLHRFMPVLVHYAGGRVLEMPVLHHPRTAGKSKYGVWNRLGRGLWDLSAIAWYRRRHLGHIPAVEHISAGREAELPVRTAKNAIEPA